MQIDCQMKWQCQFCCFRQTCSNYLVFSCKEFCCYFSTFIKLNTWRSIIWIFLFIICNGKEKQNLMILCLTLHPSLYKIINGVTSSPCPKYSRLCYRSFEISLCIYSRARICRETHNSLIDHWLADGEVVKALKLQAFQSKNLVNCKMQDPR